MFNQNDLIIILISFLAGFATIIGAFIAPYFKNNIKGLVAGLGFAAGIMILISIFKLVPKSLAPLGLLKTSIILLVSVLFMYLLNILIPHTHLLKEKRHEGSSMKAAYMTAIGIILHDFPEGLAIASSYIFSSSLGFLVAITTLLHNIPEGFAMSIPAVPFKKKSFIIKVAILPGVSLLLGSIFGIFVLYLLPGLEPFFMAFAAGAMIFVSFHELLPMAQKYKNNLFLILGVALSIVIYFGLFFLFPE